MAGIGVKLITYMEKSTLTTDVIGMGYSTVMTIAPMLRSSVHCVSWNISSIFSSVGYVTRELFFLYGAFISFIFALLTASPF